MRADVQYSKAREARGGESHRPSFFSATPRDRYEFRLLVADYLKLRGLIKYREWCRRVNEAVAAYADELG
ncbi:hypothetical protein C4J94_2827 [Pseudomonas sp. R5-89-07]|nr:hypothetical protein C4J94_2827 [Pseudomonas sp. R5-89-07]